MVTSNANTPPTTASMLRVNGPPAGAGRSTTSSDCRPSWVVKMVPLSRNRASRIEKNSTTAACQMPAPSQCSSRSPTTIPMVQPSPTSTTRRSLGSLEKPRAIREEVAANSGPVWPRMYSAKA